MSSADVGCTPSTPATPGRNWYFEPLLPLFYELIAIDVAWTTKMRSERGYGKSAQAHYRCMPDDEVLALPVGELASMNCLLLMWTVAPKLDFAFKCLERWGFDYVSFLIWRKRTVNGKTRMGPGYRVRTTAELVLMAKIGNPKQDFAPQTEFDGLAREHSRKPEEFYQLCDRLMPHARRADVFARQRRPGWDAFGDELELFPEEED